MLEGSQQFTTPRGSKGWRGGARLGPLPLGTGAELAGCLGHVVDSSRLVREPCAVEQFDDLGLGLATPHNGQVVVQLDRAGAFDDDGRRSADLAEPLADEVGVADGRRERHEAHRRWREDDDLLPHPPAEGVLEVVDLVEDHEAEGHQLDRLGEQHVTQHFSGHHDHVGVAVDRRVAGQQSHPVGSVESA